ncbi:hypothetical protein GOP47_0011881 [Adiantum capillus-veneris]|uniref:Uncharacterized protein n=1 Tax=Adiantum capillus-veneris TaxID=13818 RepID=A0A9D4ZFT3_ADICA|nr:hypothetical protein GOP47_0011881 [Adiantum capillus-veneris]
MPIIEVLDGRFKKHTNDINDLILAIDCGFTCLKIMNLLIETLCYPRKHRVCCKILNHLLQCYKGWNLSRNHGNMLSLMMLSTESSTFRIPYVYATMSSGLFQPTNPLY